MKVTTDDGRFGIVVTPQGGPRFFRFQLIIDGRLVGDTGAGILGSAMQRLGDLERLDDERLGGLAGDPAAVSSALLSDDALHTASTLSIAESLDDWLVQAYVHDGTVVFLAQEHADDEPDGLRGPVLVAVVDVLEYDAIFNAVYNYWHRQSFPDQYRSETSRS